MTHPVPKVAVVIPCYNHARYLAEAVASVVGQTFHDWEIVIVDNGSADDSAQVANRLIERFRGRRIRLLVQPPLGAGAGRNVAIRASRAPYVLPLDADDLLGARFLERTLPVLESNSGLGFVSTNVRFFGAERGHWSGGEPTRERMLYDSRLTVTALLRREAWEQVRGFSERRDWQGYEDWDFWLRLIERGWRGTLVPEELFWYRRQPSSSHARSQSADLLYRARLVLDHPTLYPPGFALWAEGVQRDATSGKWHWHWLAGYLRLVARHAPRELPKAMLRPAFKSLGPRPQMFARRLAQALGLSRKV